MLISVITVRKDLSEYIDRCFGNIFTHSSRESLIHCGTVSFTPNGEKWHKIWRTIWQPTRFVKNSKSLQDNGWDANVCVRECTIDYQTEFVVHITKNTVFLKVRLIQTTFFNASMNSVFLQFFRLMKVDLFWCIAVSRAYGIRMRSTGVSVQAKIKQIDLNYSIPPSLDNRCETQQHLRVFPGRNPRADVALNWWCLGNIHLTLLKVCHHNVRINHLSFSELIVFNLPR